MYLSLYLSLCIYIYIYMYTYLFITEVSDPRAIAYALFKMPFESSSLPGSGPMFPLWTFENCPYGSQLRLHSHFRLTRTTFNYGGRLLCNTVPCCTVPCRTASYCSVRYCAMV